MKNEKEDMSFLEHLEELRWHLIRSIIAIVIIAIAAFIFRKEFFEYVIEFPSSPDFPTNKLLNNLGEALNLKRLSINRETVQLMNTELTGQFLTSIKISVITGFVLAFPYILFEFWRFIQPALYKNEKKYASGVVLAMSFLFFSGVVFGYFIISPLSINFLSNFNLNEGIENKFVIMSYVSVVASIALASGLLFELPVLAYFLSKMGIITPKTMKRYRKHALVVVLIVSAIITPPDIYSQILVAFPLMFLYEISITISKGIYKKRQEKLAG